MSGRSGGAPPPKSEPTPTASVEGTVSRVVYAATDGIFAVVRLDVTDRDAPVTVVGPLGGLSAGERVRIDGAWERHASHGQQLRAQRAVAVLPKSPDGVRRYLEGLSGIGPALAKKLVSAFGADAIEVLEREPWRAAQVPGVGKRRALAAGDDAKGRAQEREVMVWLQGRGVSAAWAARIRRAWGDDAMARLRRNPYLLAREVPGIGFATADQIARGLGIEADSPLRIEAGLYHALERFSDEGHCFAPRELLIEEAELTLGAPAAAVADALAGLTAQGAIIVEEDAVWLPRMHLAEVQLARRLRALLAAPRRPLPATKGARAQRELAALSAGQRRSVELARGGGVCVLTGGPGTGKTTVVKTIVRCFAEADRRIVLGAPTGRAAKRLAEATGRPAHTVHRLLEAGRGGAWGRSEDRPLEADLVVIDESSMLDLPLARALAAAVPLGATLLLVGDVDQLPSVGPGQVLADVIGSGAVPVARLTEIFRQGEGSRIIANAHRVLHGESPEVAATTDGSERGDFFLARADDPARAAELVVRLCRERIPEVFHLHPSRDVQVLTPMHRGDAGTEALNRALQGALNPGGDELARKNRSALRVGDKVIQTRNDYDRDVFNGDVGEVASIDREEAAVEVRFDDRPGAVTTRYQGEALDQLELAYALTIHKSQGSEYPAVVIALLPQHHLLLRRNLLYTAITRGKRLVVLVGAPRAIRRAVETADAEKRHTRLRQRLAAPR